MLPAGRYCVTSRVLRKTTMPNSEGGLSQGLLQMLAGARPPDPFMSLLGLGQPYVYFPRDWSNPPPQTYRGVPLKRFGPGASVDDWYLPSQHEMPQTLSHPPPGSVYSPSRQKWRTPSGFEFDADDNEPLPRDWANPQTGPEEGYS
jgi:hypothetical protein